jgi:hypothetical protein
VTGKPKYRKVKVQDIDDATAIIHLPVLPPEMDHEHDIIFQIGDRVIFGIFVHRYENGDIGVELFDPDKTDSVANHKFTEAK